MPFYRRVVKVADDPEQLEEVRRRIMYVQDPTGRWWEPLRWWTDKQGVWCEAELIEGHRADYHLKKIHEALEAALVHCRLLAWVFNPDRCKGFYHSSMAWEEMIKALIASVDAYGKGAVEIITVREPFSLLEAEAWEEKEGRE